MGTTSERKTCTNCIERKPSQTEQISLDFSALNFWSNFDEEIAVAERLAENIDKPNGTVVSGLAKLKFM